LEVDAAILVGCNGMNGRIYSGQALKD